MDTNIRAIPKRQKLAKKVRVAAYARVSTGKESMLHSLSYQVSYYNSYIQKHKDWLFAGIYIDEAISGTKDERPEFQKLLNECRNGNVDLIVTKSVSRFARNTITILKTIRELTSLGVDVFFEEQNVHTLSAEGEIVITALACYAEAEARSMSENTKWRVQKNFTEGKVYSMTILGYRIVNSHLEIEPSEAKAVKRIFDLYLEGLGNNRIIQKLNEEGYKTRFNRPFSYTSVFAILRNRTYTGDLLLQTTYSLDPISKKTMRNNGEFDMFLVENDHKPIISRDVFLKVQDEIIKRQIKHSFIDRKREESPFSHKLECAFDGRKLIRRECRGVISWRCSMYEKGGKKACPSKQVPELSLINEVNELLSLSKFDADVFNKKVSKVIVGSGNQLIFYMKDGEVIERTYKDKSRKWTPEMKKKMSDLKKGFYYAKSKCNQSNN